MNGLTNTRQAELWQQYYLPDEFMKTSEDYLSGGEVGRWLNWDNIQFQLHLRPRSGFGIWWRKLFGKYDTNKLEDNYRIVSERNGKKLSITVQFYREGKQIKSKCSVDNGF